MSPRKKSGRRGIFIAVEGIDGAGTTTQSGKIARWLRRKGKIVHRTAEPTKGPVGKFLRNLLKSGRASPEQLALLFAADRLYHLEEIIIPAIERGECVVSDRYRLSSLAYQSIECDARWVAALNRYAPPPDLTILIDLPVKAALRRLKSRSGSRERFEYSGKLEKVRKNYLDLARRKDEGRVVIIDGSPPEREVLTSIKEVIMGVFKKP